MTKDEYSELNNYLNDAFLYLEKNNSFLNNIPIIGNLCNLYIETFNDYQKKEVKKNHLTFEDVYMIARKIIETIDSKYLEEYDKIIEKGILDFSYNNAYNASHFLHPSSNCLLGFININREFNYNDICILIHEFIHYTNSRNDKLSINHEILAEFISIYFENYAEEYLLKNGVLNEEINIKSSRIYNTLKDCKIFNIYAPVLFTYKQFGSIDEQSYNLLYNYYIKIEKHEFDNCCKKVLNSLKIKEKVYLNENQFNKEYDYNKLIQSYGSLFENNYKYIIGTILSMLAKKYSNLKEITFLNNHINDYEYANKSILQILKEINIDINKEYFFEELKKMFIEEVENNKIIKK